MLMSAKNKNNKIDKKYTKNNKEEKKKKEKSMGKGEQSIDTLLKNFFKHYKINILISTTILLLAIFSLYYHAHKYGDVLTIGVDFKGGYQYNVYYNGTINSNIVNELMKENPGSTIRIISSKGILIMETPNKINITQTLENKGIQVNTIQTRSISSTIGKNFWKDAIKMIIIAYLSVIVVVVITFRNFVPSLAIVMAGLSDIICAMALMNVFNIPLTLGSLTALLILIGYSVDTDILLSTRVLRVREGDIYDRMVSSAKTGLTMTTTSIVAMLSLYLISTSPVLDNISLVIMFGLFADIIFTWFQNTSILRFYVKE